MRSPLNVKNKFLEETNNLNTEMDQLNEMIQEVTKHHINKSVMDIENLTANLEQTKYSLKLATQIVHTNEAMKKIVQYKKEKKYIEVAKQITYARGLINDIPVNERLDIIKTTHINLTLERECLLSELSNIWQKAVILDKKEEDNIINIVKIDNNTFDLKGIMEALYYEKNIIRFKEFANFISNEILIPVINNTVQIKIFEEDNFEILSIEIKNKSSKMDYRSVFDNITTVIDFFCCKINYILDTNLNFLGYIGHEIREQFCEVFIKNCLADTVPSTQEGLVEYKKIVEEIELLQTFLTECGFFNKECSKILEYAGNIDVLFANKICKTYLDKAILIIKKDLHDMIEIGADSNQCLENQKIIDFPHCYVSRSSCEILNLVRTILDQAVTSSDMCAGRLLFTSKQILENYCKLIPVYHKKLLESIPQQVALFYNNCMYLAHELERYEHFYPEHISKQDFTDESFDYQINILRSAGRDAFLQYIQSQIKQIQDILDGSELAILGSIEKLDPNADKSIRQCLRQLELLKTVWQKVLPYEIYNKSIGDLLNSFVDHLIKLVLDVEDISADTSTMLVEMFTLVQTRGPKLFTEPKEINMYTKHWYKFSEMIILLNSTMTDINDRWADGKGPLAVEYSAEDIRKLIRALFQNTDRRAALLSTIV